ncbi:unnamed protein product (macronuclear) [Paramecium tetraurelia]|uniref:Glutathione S-transferase n=1 Tax=Paramecium tetraurelia TaxID=5888 RepID=A0E5D8_PARTE|nr:uncharacterized protein GSPATT00023682001 [Paramecium tetraurelia]CAK90505.1 unnamed protein product [Paramecium tetraurelia]|eukprot:XP_001457902.1 hypothetical protein (macronuclear) [Paramecium tetraurelia strain d4-2]
MSITLYFNPYSHRCLSVKTVLLLTKSDFNEKIIDVLKGENVKQAFTNINPNQTVPAITEGFFSLFESHAIIKYICINKPDYKLYPNTLQQKALVDSYLDWHQNEFTKLLDYSKECYLQPLLIGNKIPENRVSRLVDVEEVLVFFTKTFLNNGQYNYIYDQPSFTLADIRAVCDLTSLFICNFDFEKFPILEQYIWRMFKITDLYQSHKEYFNLIQKQKYKNQFIQSILTKQIKQEQITLYFYPLSSPSRAVRSLFLMAKIEYNEKVIDILKSENKSDNYTQINPNQTVPCIKQGTFTLFESHAILKYICEQYMLLDFYPQENLRLKAQIDSYLDFHLSEMRQITEFVMSSQKNQNEQELKDKQKNIDQLLQFFVKIFLNEGKYKYIYNHKTISIADLSAVNEILFLVMINYEFNNVPQIQKYIANIIENSQVKQSNKEYFSTISSNQHNNLNQFNKQIITTTKKRGCC